MSRPRIIAPLALLLLTLPLMALILVAFGSRPEQRLLGSWEEVAWSYEKLDPASAAVGTGETLGDELRKEITQGLVIHESEYWQFGTGAALVLRRAGTRSDTIRWRLKGHGHMLELVFGDAHQEVYKVRELTDDRMVLQFNNDMIARGVVRIEFKRSTTDA